MVWEDGGCIWKRQPKYLMDNEVHALSLICPSGWAPEFYRVELELLRMQKLVSTPITDPVIFRHRCNLFLEEMKKVGLRHGDLTVPHLFHVRNWPMIIDWSESRIEGDPRPDKRREGDLYWMQMSCEKVIEKRLDFYGR